MPTQKAKGIEDFLTALAGISRQIVEAGICTWCKKPIGEFRDELSRKEYGISGMCQKCQDDTFGEG